MLSALLLLACSTGDDSYPLPTPADSAADTAPTGPLVMTLTPPIKAVDECQEACITARVTREGEPVNGALVDIWVGDKVFGADATTRGDGEAQVCGTGFDVGMHDVTATAELGIELATATTSFELRPFGWTDGFIRDDTPVTEIPWTPQFSRYQADPVLPPGPEGSWSGLGTIVPSVARTDDGWVMWYAGTSAVDYVVGAATSPDGVIWTEAPGNPLLNPDGIEGSWLRYSTNSPMVIEHDGTWYVYYTGRMEETGNLNIGLATGPDPIHVEDVPVNPVFSWTPEEESWSGQAVAHPSVTINEDGWWEMWYSTGYHKIGYAYSADGLSWSRYCKNPVFEGDMVNTWETNQVKANEVVLHNGWYMMTYTGGDTGAFRVGWAMSRDGLHWARSPEPALTVPDEPGTWESNSVLSAPMVVVGDELWMWYSGTGIYGSAVGLAKASLEGAP
ncbi:hypothetical protein LBMAG42_51400 [Deltaproteobacteria bacterium]|nr:hypothetical protein LBMAG42_51400 [Deltaproteobacteria bacterium]